MVDILTWIVFISFIRNNNSILFQQINTDGTGVSGHLKHNLRKSDVIVENLAVV